MHLLQQSEATAAQRRILVYLVDDTDGKTAETSVTVSAGDIKISKNGAAEANHGGTWTEVAGGLYYYEYTSAELDTLGFVTFRIVKAGVRTFVKEAQVVPFDPYSAASLGLTNLDAAITTRATPAQVNTEVLDVLNVDTFAEPGQEAPPATTTLVKKLGYLYKFLRNKITVTSTEIKVFNDDAATVDHKSTHSDDATTYTRGEFATGP